MTNKEITETIEKEFGWLSPDEKQKLNVMMVRTWNEAIVASADVVMPAQMAIVDKYERFDDKKYDILYEPSKEIKASINTLKLKL